MSFTGNFVYLPSVWRDRGTYRFNTIGEMLNNPTREKEMKEIKNIYMLISKEGGVSLTTDHGTAFRYLSNGFTVYRMDMDMMTKVEKMEAVAQTSVEYKVDGESV